MHRLNVVMLFIYRLVFYVLDLIVRDVEAKMVAGADCLVVVVLDRYGLCRFIVLTGYVV